MADGSTLTGEAGTGFFHQPRGTQRTSYAGVSASAGLVGMDQLRARFKEGNDRFHKTQCIDHGSQISDFRERFESTGGVRPSTSEWPIFDANETKLSSVSGLCGMPTHFLGSVRVGSPHRTARWMSITQNTFKFGAPTYNTFQNERCTQMIQMILPRELLYLDDIPRPTSNALSRFEAIAWDGVDSINSAWDTCIVGT